MTNKGQINYQSSCPNQGYKTCSTFNFLFNVDILQHISDILPGMVHFSRVLMHVYIEKKIGIKGKKYKIIDRVIAMCFFIIIYHIVV